MVNRRGGDLLKFRFAKRDNTHTPEKLYLRNRLVQLLGKSHLTVLDAYSGTGLLWQQVVDANPDVEFDITSVEKKRNERTDVIVGDNLKVMPGLDLSSFDLIDLDAYGWPYAQLALCAEHAPGVPVTVTCIHSTVGQIPRKVLAAQGIPDDWPTKSPSLFTRLGTQRSWDAYCASLGYTLRVGFTFTGSMTKMYHVLLDEKAPASLARPGAWTP